MASGNLATIVEFFQKKGIADFIIAGIVGNLKIESGFSPTAYNPNEGAIGLVQWEGGRRTALQQWAASHGGQETDLKMQLSFLWHEMNTSESGAWRSVLQGASNVQEAAALWDQYYERSSGEARQDRIDAAVHFAQTGRLPGASNTGGTVPGGGLFVTGAGPTADSVTRSDLTAVDDLGKLFKVIPELKKLLNKAMSNDWTVTRFENAVQNTDWYKNHSQTARAAITQRLNDPASWQQNIQNVESSIHDLAHQLGMPLTGEERHALAVHALMTGNDGNQSWLTERISNHQEYGRKTDVDDLRGGMAATAQQLQQLAAAYGMRWDDQKIAQFAQNVVDGTTTIDTYKNRLIGQAKSTFPSFAKEIDAGTTVAEISDAYVQSMSNLLELNPDQLDVFTPKIRRAMQGVMDPKSKERVPVSISDFEDQVRKDPRWQYTQNAKDTMSQMLLQVGADLGFGPEA